LIFISRKKGENNIKLSKMLSSFDHTALQISRTKTYSSLLGKVIGIVIIISLALTFAYKIIGVINK
jgi:hypothetical protein